MLVLMEGNRGRAPPRRPGVRSLRLCRRHRPRARVRARTGRESHDRVQEDRLTEQPAPGRTRTIATPVEHLDLATVIKVSQAVSGELVLENLIDRVMRTAIEHAGAERGLLIGLRSDELRVEAEATTSGKVSLCV